MCLVFIFDAEVGWVKSNYTIHGIAARIGFLLGFQCVFCHSCLCMIISFSDLVFSFREGGIPYVFSRGFSFVDSHVCLFLVFSTCTVLHDLW